MKFPFLLMETTYNAHNAIVNSDIATVNKNLRNEVYDVKACISIVLSLSLFFDKV